MASLLVFGIILTIFLSSWNSVLNDQTEFNDEERIRMQAEHTSTFLVSTPGYPEDWEKSGVDVEVPGFASNDHVIQESKLEEFRGLSYEEQKELLQAENFILTVENETGTLELEGDDLVFGQNYSNPDTVVPITRNVLVNISGAMKNAELNYVVWR